VAASPSGGVDAAVMGKRQSLWYFSGSHGKWHRTEVAGSRTVFSGPSVCVTFTESEIAVQGARHTPGRRPEHDLLSAFADCRVRR
jgi:hypothetical protein